MKLSVASSGLCRFGHAAMFPPPATASAEGAQLNGRSFPATASAEGRLIKGGPSLWERVRVRGFVPGPAWPLRRHCVGAESVATFTPRPLARLCRRRAQPFPRGEGAMSPPCDYRSGSLSLPLRYGWTPWKKCVTNFSVPANIPICECGGRTYDEDHGHRAGEGI
jgi:hypothetical protein